MLAGRLVAEIMIEGEDTMDLGARQVARFCDHRDRGLGHVAEGLLQGMQHHQGAALDVSQAGDDLRPARLFPWFVN